MRPNNLQQMQTLEIKFDISFYILVGICLLKICDLSLKKKKKPLTCRLHDHHTAKPRYDADVFNVTTTTATTTYSTNNQPVENLRLHSLLRFTQENVQSAWI